MFYGMIFFAFAGASAGISVGMLFFHEKTYKQEVELRVASICALSGAFIGFFLGAILWGLVNETGRGRSIARFMSVAVLLTSCGAPLGWLIGVGRQTSLGVPFVDRSSGMMWGLILGMPAGLILALIEYRWLHEMSESPIGPPDPPVRPENSASGLNTAKNKYPIAAGNPIDFVLVAHDGAAGCVCVFAGPVVGIAYGLFFFSRAGRQDISVGATCALWGTVGGLVVGVVIWQLCRAFSRVSPIMFALAMTCFVGAVGAIVAWDPGERRSMNEGINLRATWMGWGSVIGGAIGLALALLELFRFHHFSRKRTE
jgi:hypothetical protein